MHGTGGDFCLVHFDAHDGQYRGGIQLGHGSALAGYGALDQWVGRAYLWPALYGHAVWHRVLFPSARQLHGGLVRRQTLRSVWWL